MLFALAFFVLSSRTDLIDQVAASGRCVEVGEVPQSEVSSKQMIAPGSAPVLSFRYFEDKKHHRFDNMDLMLDDAGH